MTKPLKPSEVISPYDRKALILNDDSPVDPNCGIDSTKIDAYGIVALLQGKKLYFDDGEYAHILYFDKGE